MAFAELGLNPLVLHCLETTGYTIPTEVQRQAVPAALEGRDLLVSSHTGSGKTAAFLLPSLHKLAEPSKLPGNGPRLLVLCPTRELALQVQKQAMIYGAGLRKLKTVCLVGGAPFGPQFQALKVHPEVMIATPGRLIDHLERGRIDFSRLEVLVLDEADRMLDMGFIEDIEHIVKQTPDSRQTLLFSATLDGMVGKIAAEMTREPLRVDVAKPEEHKANIDQRILYTDDLGHKRRLLDFLLRDVGLTQAVVFTSTKASAEELCETLLEQGFAAAALHGDMPQHKRNRTLQRLRDGAVSILVATDVAARGIDVAGISHVINFDAPRQAEDYVHRIGRTGRAGRSGIAITLVHGKERHLVRQIEHYLGESVRVETIPGLEPTARHEKSFDKKRGGGFKSGYGNREPGRPSWGEKFYGDKKPAEGARETRHDKPWGERKFADKPHGERPWADKPRGDKPWGDKPRADKPWGDKPQGERPQGERPQGERTWADKPRADKPWAEKKWADKPPRRDDAKPATHWAKPRPEAASPAPRQDRPWKDAKPAAPRGGGRKDW